MTETLSHLRNPVPEIQQVRGDQVAGDTALCRSEDCVEGPSFT
jgi:hypothetical protein